MKRYWLFVYDTYYPRGGMIDFAGSYDTIEEPIKLYNSIDDRVSFGKDLDKFHIFDSKENTIVYIEERGDSKIEKPISVLLFSEHHTRFNAKFGDVVQLKYEYKLQDKVGNVVVIDLPNNEIQVDTGTSVQDSPHQWVIIN